MHTTYVVLFRELCGEQYSYSNTNYFIPARVFGQVSGLSYETYIRSHVLNPSGIGVTMYLGEASAIYVRAKPIIQRL